MTWFCLDCSSVGELTIHGRCSACDSDAVAIAESYGQSADKRQAKDIAELVRMYAK